MNYRPLVLLLALGYPPGAESMAEPEIIAATPAPAPAATAQPEQARLTSAQLDELLSPIALYPDPLIALVLPASTFPTDVVMAARYLKAGGDPQAVESQPWDDSVKALARYPEVVKWMDENLAWTRQLGEVFAFQPADVLTATQRLRAAARAAGNLTDTPQQTVVVEREVIRIVPAQPDVIYVPVYDPVYVYRPRIVHHYYHPGPIIRFSSGYRAGFWLSYHCDWNYRTVLVIGRPHRHEVWHTQPRWVCPTPAVAYQHHVWRPARNASHAARGEPAGRPRQQIVQPASNVIATTPAIAAARRPDAVSTPRPGPQHQPAQVRPPARPAAAPAVANPVVADARLSTERHNRFPEGGRPSQAPRAGTPSSGPAGDGDALRHRIERRQSTGTPPTPFAAASGNPAVSPAPAVPRADPAPSSPNRRIQFETTNRTRGEESGSGLRSSGRVSSPRINPAPPVAQVGDSVTPSDAPTRRIGAAQATPSPAVRERAASRPAATPRPSTTRTSAPAQTDTSTASTETGASSPRSRRQAPRE